MESQGYVLQAPHPRQDHSDGETPVRLRRIDERERELVGSPDLRVKDLSS